MSHKSAPGTVSTIGIDLGKNSFHLVGLDQRGAIVWQLKCSRGQLERRLANIPCCLIGMEALPADRRAPLRRLAGSAFGDWGLAVDSVV
jgi:transposase